MVKLKKHEIFEKCEIKNPQNILRNGLFAKLKTRENLNSKTRNFQ